LILRKFSFLSSLYTLVYRSFVWCIAREYFLPLCGWSLQFRDLFLLLCRSFLISCSPICPSLLWVSRLLEFYWGGPCLYLGH
jgi:hypothetical protein